MWEIRSNTTYKLLEQGAFFISTNETCLPWGNFGRKVGKKTKENVVYRNRFFGELSLKQKYRTALVVYLSNILHRYILCILKATQRIEEEFKKILLILQCYLLHDKRAQAFTSLMADLHQDKVRVFIRM